MGVAREDSLLVGAIREERRRELPEDRTDWDKEWSSSLSRLRCLGVEDDGDNRSLRVDFFFVSGVSRAIISASTDCARSSVVLEDEETRPDDDLLELRRLRLDMTD